jgi:hypothetical protein
VHIRTAKKWVGGRILVGMAVNSMRMGQINSADILSKDRSS